MGAGDVRADGPKPSETLQKGRSRERASRNDGALGGRQWLRIAKRWLKATARQRRTRDRTNIGRGPADGAEALQIAAEHGEHQQSRRRGASRLAPPGTPEKLPARWGSSAPAERFRPAKSQAVSELLATFRKVSGRLRERP